jgi:hypothetical protein
MHAHRRYKGLAYDVFKKKDIAWKRMCIRRKMADIWG